MVSTMNPNRESYGKGSQRDAAGNKLFTNAVRIIIPETHESLLRVLRPNCHRPFLAPLLEDSDESTPWPLVLVRRPEEAGTYSGESLRQLLAFSIDPTPTGTYLEKAEIDALLASPNRNTQQGRKDHALLLFLYNSVRGRARRQE